MNDWALLRAIAADCTRGPTVRAILESELTDEATALAALRRLADAGLVTQCGARPERVSERDAAYRVSAEGMAVLLNAVML